MRNILTWLNQNKTWIFSGCGVAIATALVRFGFAVYGDSHKRPPPVQVMYLVPSLAATMPPLPSNGNEVLVGNTGLRFTAHGEPASD